MHIFISIFIAFAIVFISLFGIMSLLIFEIAFLIPLLIAVALSLIVMELFYFFQWKKTKKGRQIMYGFVSLSLVISLFFVLPDLYDRNVEALSDNSYELLDEYMPFKEGTKAVTLSEPSTFSIEQDLPIIDGATALYPLYSAFVQATYPEDVYDYYDSELMSNRTGQAYENLIFDKVDIIFALAPSEQQEIMAKQYGKEFKLTPIGREAFVFFVNDKNTINSLTTKQIKDIYSGEITNWNEVGGKNNEIRAFQRPQDSGSQTALQDFMGNTPIMEAPTENITSLMGGIIEEVSDYKNYKNAIGFTFRFYSTEMVANDEIKLLAIDGVEPTKETIRSGEYPLNRELYAITTNDSGNPHLNEFIEWILSPQGQELVEKTGYVSIKE